MKTWKEAAKFCQDVYGSFVDWEEEFFICPECDEPIYLCDYRDPGDWSMCPVCEMEWDEEEFD